MLELRNKITQIKTPSYVYDLNRLRETLKDLKQASEHYKYHVHYAVKANVNKNVLALISSFGFGADCVSGYEISHAISCGFDHSKTVFAGVGKSDEEIELAIDSEIFCFNCESIEEIEVIENIASIKQKKVRIALRLNPDVDAKTHAYITTGLNENKFGIHTSHLEKIIKVIQESDVLDLIGLHFHIGSQIQSLEPFKNLCLKANSFIKWFEQHNIRIKHINVGGGLGVDYENPESSRIDFDSYFNVFNTFLEVESDQQVHFELGRSVVAQCGYLLSKVLYIKKGITKDFMILDAGMSDLLRPALYQASHKITNITNESQSDNQFYDVVGPICESSDCFGKHVLLPKSERNDLVLIHSVGAYGHVMANTYNLRPLIKEYCINN